MVQQRVFRMGNPMFRLVRSLREGEIVKISGNGFRSLKRLRVRPRRMGSIFTCGLFPRNAGAGLWGDLDWHYSPDTGDYSSIEIQKAVDSVWERIMDDHRWYLGFYVSLSEIIGMLKDELRKLHIFVPEKVVNRKATGDMGIPMIPVCHVNFTAPGKIFPGSHLDFVTH